ncbi:putative disease resistance protein RGA3 isoform X2 [Carex rostrata]
MDPLSIAAIGWLMSALVSKAVTSLLEAWAKRIGLGKEFKILKDQLRKLGALLKSARRLETENSFLDELVQDLQKLAYQAENLLDELDYYRLQDEIQQRATQEKASSSNKSSVASSSSSFLPAIDSIRSTLEGMTCRSAPDALVPLSKTSLSERMNKLAEQLEKSEANVRKAVTIELQYIAACKTEATKLCQTSSFFTEPRVFGRDQECDQLVNLLTNEESAIVGKVSVLAIVGSGGVGKTTLARQVFNDKIVHSYFQVRLWICVSTRFDINRLTREMLEGACGTKCDLTNLNELQNKLKNELGSKRFLLILDDMWEDKDKSQWDLMVAPLNNCMGNGSIILVTTRNHNVAKIVDATDKILLKGLDENAFLSFFSTCIFNDPNFGGNCRLRKIGQEIANKLKCNPLAAKTVSALLKENPDERYWMEIRDSEEWKSQSGQDHIMSALRLSYEHMPFHLQRCFSYCVILPEDHPFTCEELVYQWMAQGYLDVRFEGKRMEDIGRAYFNDLFNRGFFQTIQTRHDEVHYTFHDLIHDLADMVAFKECLTINGPKSRQIPPTIRHLSIFTSTKRGEEAIARELTCLKGEHLSTIFNWDELSSGTFRSISDLLKETKFLRAMRLVLFPEVQPHNLNFQNFISLRYLKLISPPHFKSFQTLPEEICRLYHLEVLQIGQMWSMLPDNFSDLVRLRHFIAEEYLMHSKIQGVGKLTSLQELNDFAVQQKKGFEIEQLGSLEEIGGSLHIWNLENVKSKTEASKARLAEKEKLDALYLDWKHGEQENESVLEGLKPTTNLKSLTIVGYGGVASPTWLEPSLIFLKSLFLKGCKAWELLPPIGELESLKCLELSKLAVREIGPQCYGTRQSMKFPSLEKLKIKKMPDLEKWVWSDQLQQFLCFKKLKKLTIRHCPNLVDLPLSGSATSEVLERFPSLETLKIKWCPLIFQLPPLPYSSLLSTIDIRGTGCINQLRLFDNKTSLKVDKSSSLKLDEVLAFHEISSLDSLDYLKISNFSSLESLDLHSFEALQWLIIEGCQSLTSITFVEHLISLKSLKIISCKSLRSMKGVKSLVNLDMLKFRECPGFIPAWDSALKEIETTEPDFSLSLTTIYGDSLALITLPICKQLSSLHDFKLEFSSFTEEHEVSPQFLTSLNLVDIRGCKKNLQSFPFDLFPSLEEMFIKFPRIQSLPTSSCIEITDECKKLRNIKEVHFNTHPLRIKLKVSSEEMISQQMDADN